MKRCPKCNRTFPDDNQKFCTVDGGLLRATDTLFDPNATIASTSTPPKEPDLGATIASSSSAPTVVLPKDTGPTGSATASNFSQQQQPQSRPAAPPPAPQFGETVALPRRRARLHAGAQRAIAACSRCCSRAAEAESKLPLVLGILAILWCWALRCVVPHLLIIKPRLDQVTPEQPIVVRETRPETSNERERQRQSE